MLLCLDIGNSQIHGGVYDDDKLLLQFRKSSTHKISSDEYGVFFRSVLKENNINPENISAISLCSVVPEVVYSIRNGSIKYFDIDPFILKAGVKTGLKIKYYNPQEVGSDRIANAIAATNLYPDQNLIVIDFGTATTFCVINKNREYLGGVILPGLRISMEALESKTAKLQSVEIVAPNNVVGKSTKDSIQSGLYYGHVGFVNEIKKRIIKEEFNNEKPIIIATGGFSGLFEKEDLFDVIHQDLVLKGLHNAYKINK